MSLSWKAPGKAVRLAIAALSIMVVAGCSATVRPSSSTATSATEDESSGGEPSGVEDAMFDSAKARFVDEVFDSCEQPPVSGRPECVPETLLYALDDGGPTATLCAAETKDPIKCILWGSLTYGLARQARVDQPAIDRDNPSEALRATVDAIRRASFDVCLQRDPSKVEGCVAEDLQERLALTTEQKAVCAAKPVPLERVQCTFLFFLVQSLEDGRARVKDRQLQKA